MNDARKAACKRYRESEKGKLYQKEYRKQYRKTAAGKLARKRYQQSEKGKLALKLYEQTEKYKLYRRQYEQTEKRKLIRKRYRQSEKHKLALKRWYHSDAGKLKIKEAQYRRRNAAGGPIDLHAWNAKMQTLGHVCQMCQKDLDADSLTIDHIFPLSKGGTNHVDNLQPLCRPCNSSKGNKI